MKVNVTDILSFDSLIAQKFSGQEIDKAYQMLLFQSINSNNPFIPFELDNKSQLSYMLPDANNIHILCSGGVFHLIAFYNDTNSFPVARSYFIKTKNLLDVGSFLKENDSKNIREEIYGEDNYKELLQKEGDYKKE